MLIVKQYSLLPKPAREYLFQIFIGVLLLFLSHTFVPSVLAKDTAKSSNRLLQAVRNPNTEKIYPDYCEDTVQSICKYIAKDSKLQLRLEQAYAKSLVEKALKTLRKKFGKKLTPGTLFQRSVENPNQWVVSYVSYLKQLESQLPVVKPQLDRLKVALGEAVNRQSYLGSTVKQRMLRRISEVKLELVGDWVDTWLKKGPKGNLVLSDESRIYQELEDFRRICGEDGLRINAAATVTRSGWTVSVCPGVIMYGHSYSDVSRTMATVIPRRGNLDFAYLAFTLAHELGHTIGPAPFSFAPYDFREQYEGYKQCVFKTFAPDKRLPYSTPVSWSRAKQLKRTPMTEMVADFWAGQAVINLLLQDDSYSVRYRYLKKSLERLCRSGKTRTQPKGDYRVMLVVREPSVRAFLGCAPPDTSSFGCTLAGKVPAPEDPRQTIKRSSGVGNSKKRQ